ncbi:NnrU family protein [Oricola thermophila]|uniref:NnrU family protein n=1 Tax=Oricola thermophila TaxID=2742145 RepID=A0A6N1VD09_9HYPH|nr:NnrU family protein [Oricola thermophila]QKV18941.1 NnrU family protein [Oricola thermophila]
MIVLIVGLALFLGIHSVRFVVPALRENLVERMGENGWKGIYSLVALVGFGLVIWGYALARPDAPVFYEPPVWTRHIVILLMLVSMILLLAAYVPAGFIKARVKHPMLAAVKIWAFAHILANGDLATLLLAGAFLAWAVADRISVKRRGDPAFGNMSARNDVIAVVVGSAITIWFVLQLHAFLFGVSPI